MNLKVVQEVVVPKLTAGLLEIEEGNSEHQVGYNRTPTHFVI